MREFLGRWSMTLAWITMGVVVATGFLAVQVEEQNQCQLANKFRRDTLPEIFDEYTAFLGSEAETEAERLKGIRQRLTILMDEELPARECPLLW